MFFQAMVIFLSILIFFKILSESGKVHWLYIYVYTIIAKISSSDNRNEGLGNRKSIRKIKGSFIIVKIGGIGWTEYETCRCENFRQRIKEIEHIHYESQT